jgi:hypothetical protein
LDTSSLWSGNFGSVYAFVFTLLFSSFTFLSFTLPVPQGTRKAMTHLHGSSLFLLPVGGKVQAAKALLYKMTCRNCFSLSRPPKSLFE